MRDGVVELYHFLTLRYRVSSADDGHTKRSVTLLPGNVT